MIWPFKKPTTHDMQLKESNTLDRKGIAAIFSITKSKIFQSFYNREELEYPAQSLYETKRATAADSYIAESQNQYKEKIFKAGYIIKSKNEEASSYIKQRVSVLNLMSETLFDIIMQEVADDLITYSNAFLYKIRSDMLPSYIEAKSIWDKDPVCSYLRLDPCSVVIVKDKYGNIKHYELENGSRYDENRIIQKEDMIHFFVNRKPGSKYGTPYLEPVLEDIKALREIEGNVLSLIHRFCFPLYHVKVGLEKAGYTGTQNDINDIENKIATMSEDGMLVTNEKVNISAIGAESNALDMEKYLSYFEKRVFTGLNTSEAQMGRGNQTADPDTLEAQIHDTVKFFQKVIRINVENYVFNEWLLEGGFNPVLKEDDVVSFEFEEISLNTKIKIENHEVLKYQSSIQTDEETREALGKKSIKNRNALHVNQVTIHAAVEQIKAKSLEARKLARENALLAKENSDTDVNANNTNANANKQNNGQGNGKTVENKNNAVKTNNQPQNQHGLYSVKLKESLSKLQKTKENFGDIYKIYEKMRNVFIQEDIAKQLQYTEELKSSIVDLLDNYEKNSINYFLLESGFKLTNENDFILTDKEDFKSLIDKDVDRLMKDIRNKIKTKTASETFDSLSYRITFISDYTCQKYFWKVYAEMARVFKLKEIYIIFSRDDEKEGHKSVITLNSYKLTDLPPFHPFCNCKLSLSEEV